MEKVDSRVSAGKLSLTTTVGGTAYSTVLSDSDVAKFTTTLAVTDYAFDVGAYAHVRKSLGCLLSGDKLQARVIFGLSKDLGVPVPAEALKDDAPESLLRRHAASLVNMWDSWFAFLLASGKVSVILRSSDKPIRRWTC